MDYNQIIFIGVVILAAILLILILYFSINYFLDKKDDTKNNIKFKDTYIKDEESLNTIMMDRPQVPTVDTTEPSNNFRNSEIKTNSIPEKEEPINPFNVKLKEEKKELFEEQKSNNRFFN